ncbi:MAG: hypothetical protein E7590_02165 [Ruminococcaceae bacterium]|nr:hypothetical protein [Oscillospiraceae bacterium]
MKKKVFIIALAVCLAVLSIAGSSIAYFTDTEQYTNVFTAGNVDISLTANGDTVNEATLSMTDDSVYPGQTIEKNVVITNTGSENAYVGAVITLTHADGKDINTIINKAGDTDSIPVAITALLTGLPTTGYDVRVSDNGLTIYVIKNDAIAKNETANVFEDVEIPTTWDNAEMAVFHNLKLSVVAYATQEAGFSDAVTALQAAFDAFDTLPNA